MKLNLEEKTNKKGDEKPCFYKIASDKLMEAIYLLFSSIPANLFFWHTISNKPTFFIDLFRLIDLILCIVIIVKLKAAVKNYMIAKEEDRNEILENLEQLNRKIERLNKTEDQILERLHNEETKP